MRKFSLVCISVIPAQAAEVTEVIVVVLQYLASSAGD